MSWQDREAGDEQRLGRPGGDWRGFRPTFDNPITWAITLGRVAGITVRIHLFFVLFIVIMLLRSLAKPSEGSVTPAFNIMAIGMGVMFLIVLLHEFGHCIAARWTGGDADEILMWPLGGLAFTRPPHDWRSHLFTAAGGPLVNVVICTIAGLALGLSTGVWWNVAILNPLNPFEGLFLYEVSRSLVLQSLLMVNAISLVLLVFNLLPIFPLDGGRIVQSALWSKYGWSRSMIFAVRTGYIGALLLFVYGAVTTNFWIVGIAVFGGVTCYITQKQIQWSDAALEGGTYESDDYAMSVQESHERDAESRSAARKAEKQMQRDQQESQEVDRILQKIAESGIDSLTRSERALLKRVTERKRQGDST